MTLAQRQRRALLDLMREVGPLAPTMCDGWTVQDLAAHLWVREHMLRALPGIGWERFAGTTERLQAETLHRKGFAEILDELERPAGLMRVLDPLVNAAEYTIHHDDVLRPLGRSLELRDAEEEFLGKVVVALAAKAAMGQKYRLVVSPTIGKERSFGKGSHVVHVSGKPSDLLLHFSGRDSDVEIVADDVDAYKASVKGL